MSILTSCQGNASLAVSDNFGVEKNVRDTAYGKDSLQRMDIYLPANRSVEHTKAMVLIHGGGWNGGSKGEFAPYIDTLKKRLPDYAIFNINYRLVNNGNLFPAQEKDVKAAIDYIVANAAQYGINSNELVLLGFSAGGHLALLQGYKYNTPKIKAVIDFFGPTDLISMYNKPWHPLVPYALQMVTGTTPAANKTLFEQSSPVYFINQQTPPTLILHGQNDNVVDVSQSKELKAKLDAAGITNDMVIYPGERHGWYGKTLSNSFDRVEAFLKKNG